MHEMKYHPLPRSEDSPEAVQEYNVDQNRFMLNLGQYKRHWLLTFLIICLVTIKAIYLVDKFESPSGWDIENNQSDMFKIETNFSRNMDLDKYISTTILPQNNSKINFQTTINDDITTTTENAYDNENSKTKTTQMLKDSMSVSEATIINLKSVHINKTPIEKLTSEIYVNTRLMQTTKIFADLQKTTIHATSPTTTIKSKTTSIVKTPAVKSSLIDEKKYFINTSHCHIPFVEPFTPEIRKIFKPQHSTGCTKDKAIVTSSFNELKSRYILHINYTVAESLRKHSKKAKPIKEDLLCCYQQIIRSGSGSNVDARFKLLPCANFHQYFEVPLQINGILVDCKSKSKKTSLQKDAFSFVQVNKTELRQRDQNIKLEHRKPSFLLIGIDTLSRINFRRNMPETLKYLTDNKWFELRGYNKVGDNTLPNLMPLLSGYTRKTVYQKCNPFTVGGFDNCNFIWTTLKKHGYYTAYAEDTSTIATFNYKLRGFNKPPTDFYFRPMSLAIEKSLKKSKKAGLNYCVGRKQLGEYIYDYATEFTTRLKNVSTFGFFWTNSFSHNSFDISASMDTTMVKYFKEWKKHGIFEDSIVIFFSDHGERWGPLLTLSQGFLEERLPMFFLSLPNWFRQKYPLLVKNLTINQKRLSTPYDIHMTFQHLLKMAEPNYEIQQTLDCPKCQSIFEELPENRTCDDASIPEAWCTCIPFKTESTKSKVVQFIAELIVQKMNNYYELKNLTSICSTLQLNEITNAKLRYPDEAKSSNDITTYVIAFSTKPLTKPRTSFSATIDYDKHNKSIHLNIEDISRQSLYENTAKCTDDKQAKKYCICKNSFK